MKKSFILGLLAMCVFQPVRARFIVGGRSFEEMFRNADLVVIATATKTQETTERSKLIDIDKINTGAPELLQDEVIGVETDFVVKAGTLDLLRQMLRPSV